MRYGFLLFILFSHLFACTVDLHAERLRFCDGTTEEGELSYDGKELILKTGDRNIRVSKLKIARIEDRGDTYKKYRLLYDACDFNSIDNLMELARWCEKRFLVPEALSLYAKVLKIDTNDFDAREALGYIEDNGKWHRYPEDEYRYREAKLRCGDIKGYEDITNWCSTNGVSEGQKACSFYLLRLDPFHSEALKWAKPFLKEDRHSLTRPPLDRFVVSKFNDEPANAFTVFQVCFRAVFGEKLPAKSILSPIDGKVSYISAAYDDLPETEKRKPERENFVLIEGNGFSVVIYGIAKGSAEVGSGCKVRAGDTLAKVGNPMGGEPGIIMKVLNADSFSIPVIFARCDVKTEKGFVETKNYIPKEGQEARYRILKQ